MRKPRLTISGGIPTPLKKVNGYLSRNGQVFDDPAEAAFDSLFNRADAFLSPNTPEFTADQVRWLLSRAEWVGPMLVKLSEIRAAELMNESREEKPSWSPNPV